MKGMLYMKAVNVHLQNCYPQRGVVENPIFAWEYPVCDAGQEQKAYRLVIKSEEKMIFDSGTIHSAKQNNIEAGIMLKTHTKYYVRVAITNQRGETQWSEPACFLSGVCQPQDWVGSWITRPGKKPYYTGTTFTVSEGLKEAFISVCGLGQYELHLNADKVGNSVLEGSWTDFDKRVLYDTQDVSSQIKKGENKIVMEVANGWYIGDTSDDRHFYTWKTGYHAYGPELPCILLLTLRYWDGHVDRVATGPDWWTHTSPTTLANIYGSEDYDARLAIPLEQLPRVATERAMQLSGPQIPKGKLLPAMHPPVIVKRTYVPVSCKKTAAGGLLFDFGQNMAGFFEVTLRGRAGQKVRLSAVEKLDQDGQPLPCCNTWCRYILVGDTEEMWRPRFTYQAGRWLHVQPDDEERELPEVVGVRAYSVTSSAQDTGNFSCSDVRLMQVHDLIVKAAEANLNHIHSDCPTVERLGWLETNHLMGQSLMYMKDLDTLWDKIGSDIRDAQYGPDEFDVDTGAFPHQYGPGLIPSVAPRYARFLWDGGDGSFWDIIPWGSSVLLLTRWQRIFSGNSRTAKKNYETAEKYLEYLYDKYKQYNEIYGKTGDERYLCHGLGDWGHPVHGDESRENVETAFLYFDYKCLATIASELGLKDRAASHQQRAQEILERYNRDLLWKDKETNEWYYQRKGRATPSLSQANQAIPLCFGMVPADKTKSVEKSFLRSIEDGRICAGEVGLPFVFETLMRLGKHDEIYAMLLRPEHPSYYRFVTQGETTLPEFWEDQARSRCHDMMGSIFAWFYKGLGGISSIDGYATVKIAPTLPCGMEWIHCSYKAITGKIELLFEKRGDFYTIRVSLPPNVSGTLILPEGFVLADVEEKLQEISLFAGDSIFQLKNVG